METQSVGAAVAFGSLSAVGFALLRRARRPLDADEVRLGVGSEDRARWRWRVGGVVVHERFGVPKLYADGALLVEVCAERIWLRRPWAPGLEIHWRQIEGLRRVRRSLGAPTTRIDRGFDRPRIDLDLEVAQHEQLSAWLASRPRVEQLDWEPTRVLRLMTGDRVQGWALHGPIEDPWLLVRRSAGVGGEIRWGRRCRVERSSDRWRLGHIDPGPGRLEPRDHPLSAAWTQRLLRLPEVARVASELEDLDLLRELDGSTGPYR